MACIGYMQQHAEINTQKTLWAEVMTVYKPLADIENRLKSIENQITNGVGDLAKLTEEQHILNENMKNKVALYTKTLPRQAF